MELKSYYDEIHRLGKDGWSEKYYKEIKVLSGAEILDFSTITINV